MRNLNLVFARSNIFRKVLIYSFIFVGFTFYLHFSAVRALAVGVPTNLSASCTADGRLNFSWTADPTATKYAVRFYDTFSTTYGCGVNYPGLTCDNNIQGTTYSHAPIAGHTYDFWLHSIDSSGWGTGVRINNLSCAPIRVQKGNNTYPQLLSNTLSRKPNLHWTGSEYNSWAFVPFVGSRDPNVAIDQYIIPEISEDGGLRIRALRDFPADGGACWVYRMNQTFENKQFRIEGDITTNRHGLVGIGMEPNDSSGAYPGSWKGATASNTRVSLSTTGVEVVESRNNLGYKFCIWGGSTSQIKAGNVATLHAGSALLVSIPINTPIPTNTPTPQPPSGSIGRTSGSDASEVYGFSASWNDTRPSRKVALAKCTGTVAGSECKTVQASGFACPTGWAPTGLTGATNGTWCGFAVTASSVNYDWTFDGSSSNIAPGRYVVVVNQELSASIKCSGNPTCTVNGGAVNCGSAWLSCHPSADSVEFTVPIPPTATPTNTPVPAPVIDIREQYERHSKPYTLIKSTYIATVANLQRRDICTPQEIRFSVKATTAADSTYQRSTTAVITQNTTNKNIFTVTDIFQSSGAKTIKITCEKGSSVVASGTKALTIGDYTTAAPHIASQSVAASGQGAVLSWTVSNPDFSLNDYEIDITKSRNYTTILTGKLPATQARYTVSDVACGTDQLYTLWVSRKGYPALSYGSTYLNFTKACPTATPTPIPNISLLYPSLTWPTGSSAGAATTTSNATVTIAWSPIPNLSIRGYALRIDRQQTAGESSWTATATCTGLSPGDLCTDLLEPSMNALTFNTSPGFYYRVWVHAIASDGRFTGADYRWFHVTAPATPTPIPLPDLAITALTANPSSPQVGQQVTISYSAKNLSGSSVPGRRIRIYIDPVGNPPMPSTTPWKESVVAITWPVGDVQSGSWTHTFTSAKTYEVYAKVDPLNVISESNENNNLQYLGVVVVAAPTATPTPIYGVCGTTHNGCNVGTLGWAAEYAGRWDWWCNGSNAAHPGSGSGVGDILCSETKPTATPTLTPIPPTNTSIPTATPIPPTATSVPPTNTPIPPTATNTPVPTNTNVPTPTNTPIPPTATNTPIPTATPTPTIIPGDLSISTQSPSYFTDGKYKIYSDTNFSSSQTNNTGATTRCYLMARNQTNSGWNGWEKDDGTERTFQVGDALGNFTINFASATSPLSKQVKLVCGTGSIAGGLVANVLLESNPPLSFKTIETIRIRASANPSSGGSISVTDQYIEKGTDIDIVATENSGFQFKQWTESGTALSASETLLLTNATSNKSLIAEFTQNAGSLKVFIEGPKPQQGAQWRRRAVTPAQPWRASDTEESGIATGDYTIEFIPIDGWNIIAPLPTISISEGYNELRGAYYIDSSPPVLSMSPNTDITPRKSHTITVSITDLQTGIQGTPTYIWTTSATAPDDESGFNGGTVTNGATPTIPANATGDYYLHIRAVNGGGMVEVQSSGVFMVDNTKPAAPAFTPAAALFNATQSVSISGEAGVTIRYTLDGTDPTANSTLYSTPLSISESKIIKAIAIDTAGNVSDVANGEYVINGAVKPTVTYPASSENGEFIWQYKGPIADPQIWTPIVPEADGKMYLSPGSYTVRLKPVLGHTPNPTGEREISVVSGGSLDLVGSYTLSEYSISITAGANGTVEGGGGATHGDEIIVKAIPNEGYAFVSWKENGVVVSGAEAEYTFTATGNRVLQAEFRQMKGNIQITIAGDLPTGSTDGGWRMSESEEWKTIGGTVADLPVGTHKIFINQVRGYVSQREISAIVEDGATTQITVNYKDNCPGFEQGNASCDPDQKIDTDDYQCWKSHYILKRRGTPIEQFGSNTIIYHGKSITCQAADFDGIDGVTILDFSIWHTNYLKTVTPAPTPTQTPTPEVSLSPTLTPTSTPTPEVSTTPTLTPTSTPSQTPTTPTLEPTNTPTLTPTLTPTSTPTPNGSPPSS